MTLTSPIDRVALRDSEAQKFRMFRRLNQLARSRGISVILHWVGMKNQAGSVWDDMRFQSNGKRGQKETCLFCGKRLKAGNWYRLGHFVSDGDCFRERFVDSGGVDFLPRTGFRPDVIIVPAHVPGCLDTIILDFASALALYRSSMRRPYAAIGWVNRRADAFAERLVRKLDRTCRPENSANFENFISGNSEPRTV